MEGHPSTEKASCAVTGLRVCLASGNDYDGGCPEATWSDVYPDDGLDLERGYMVSGGPDRVRKRIGDTKRDDKLGRFCKTVIHITISISTVFYLLPSDT